MITGHTHRRFDQAARPVDADADACAYLNCRRPAAEHEQGRAERQIIDWARLRKCDVCRAGLGQQCRKLTGFAKGAAVYVPAEKPHGGRALRTGHGR